MKDNNLRTLVNFRLEIATLKAFDDACRLTDSSRTAILGALVREFTATAASSFPSQIRESRRVHKTLRAAVERAEQRTRALEPKTAGSTFTNRPRKSFAAFIADDPIIKKRSD